MPTVEKRCATCELDVAGQKRFKDSQGNYYCPACWEDRAAPQSKTSSASAASTRAASASVAPRSAPRTPPREVSPRMATCETCRQKVAESQMTYSPAGDLICSTCSESFNTQPTCLQCGETLLAATANGLCDICLRKAAPPKRASTLVTAPTARTRATRSASTYEDDSLGALEYILCIVFPLLGIIAAIIRVCQGDPRGKKMFKVIFIWFAIWFGLGLVVGIFAAITGAK
jgi:hypothetical protein